MILFWHSSDHIVLILFPPTVLWKPVKAVDLQVWLLSYVSITWKCIKSENSWGTCWFSRLCPTSAQVMIWQFVSLSPTYSSVLTAWSLEPASDSVFFSLCPYPIHVLSLSLKNKQTLKKIENFSDKFHAHSINWIINSVGGVQKSVSSKPSKGAN